ncbi:DeoR/GlpR family DNA-binding transcription regulator [Hyphomicrobium sp. 99]|uniref:DeoR/GlpR family DNA-binding transcription regulator n=1 Tax=Hyphomicrobium sp. 99 TaxID=1163419 RepID=UPI0005F84314|nr:DeoR/GlpR family DNA-binding transcription regulator [Hyphomicrobium sp. 99]
MAEQLPKDLKKMTKLRPDDRRDRVLKALNTNASLRITELARSLNVSTETIRRDLDYLHEKDLVQRHYGGAVAKSVGSEPPWAERLTAFADIKSAIARSAIQLFSDKDVLMLGPGATAYIFAKHLAAENRRLTVFTNNLAASSCFAPDSRTRVVIAPGEYDPAEGCTWGPETTEFIGKFRFDTSLLSVSGLSPLGGTEVVSGIAWAERAIVAQSARTVLMVDHSKFGNTCLELVCKLDDVDILITDVAPEGELLEALEEADVEIIVAEE